MIQIAFVTDTHLHDPINTQYGIDAEQNLRTILDDIAKRNINHIVIGGDIGEAISLPDFFNSVAHLNINLVPGNHDNFHEIKPYFNPAEQEDELFYIVDEVDTRLIFLDSSSEKISSTQLAWLAEMLRTEKNPVLFIHHPILDTGTAMDRLYPLQNRDEVEAVLQQSKKQVHVFCGHYHTTDERVAGNIHQYITRAVSFQVDKHPDEVIISNNGFGYRIIEIDGATITTRTVDFG